jgi:ferric-dicitrate binding protein FerR (iron transport regulator)
MDKIENIQVLLLRQLAGKLTEPEQAALNEWLEERAGNRELLQRLYVAPLGPYLESFEEFDDEAAWKALAEKLYPAFPERKAGGQMVVFKTLAAAVVIALIGIAVWLSLQRKEGRPVYAQLPVLDSLHYPDSQRVLLLNNGKVIYLDSMPDGEIAMGENARLTKSDTTLIYTPATTTIESSKGVKYHFVHVPRGKKLQVALPDGSWVWLNPESSIRFPVSFDTSARFVELRGEAFFDVQRLKRDTLQLPFIVKLPQMTVEVLGTRFLISSYNGSATKAIVTKGAVAVSNSHHRVVLNPGQQAALPQNAIEFTVSKVDTGFVTNWMEGVIVFNGEKLTSMLEKIARYKNMEVVFVKPYQDKVNDTMVGSYFLQEPIEEFINLLSFYYKDVGFRIEGQKIIVIPR